MNELKFITVKNNRKHHELLESIMLPYCQELDSNVGRETPEATLKKFIGSIVDMSEDKDRFVELCYLEDILIGFAYGKIDREEHRGYVRPGWGYVMEFYVKPEYRRKGYGREIYKHLESIFKSNGVSNIWLTADPVTGEPFWSAVGFTNSGKKSPENNLYIYEKTRTMNKVIVIGCPGSGKTTFAEKLNRVTGLPLYYLDAIWHKPDKTHISREEYDEKLAEIFATPEWIIDGNYKRTIETRLKPCDTVFLFDLPTAVCLQGATERIGKDRYDLPWIETELDSEFRIFIEEFSEKTLPYIYELIDKYKTDKQVIVFKSRKEADEYINEVKRHANNQI